MRLRRGAGEVGMAQDGEQGLVVERAGEELIWSPSSFPEVDPTLSWHDAFDQESPEQVDPKDGRGIPSCPECKAHSDKVSEEDAARAMVQESADFGNRARPLETLGNIIAENLQVHRSAGPNGEDRAALLGCGCTKQGAHRALARISGNLEITVSAWCLRGRCRRCQGAPQNAISARRAPMPTAPAAFDRSVATALTSCAVLRHQGSARSSDMRSWASSFTSPQAAVPVLRSRAFAVSSTTSDATIQ